jgi:hypothetical protein
METLLYAAPKYAKVFVPRKPLWHSRVEHLAEPTLRKDWCCKIADVDAKLLTVSITNFANVNGCVFVGNVWYVNANDSDRQQTRYVLSLDTLGNVA